jgi:hypothetical protein
MKKRIALLILAAVLFFFITAASISALDVNRDIISAARRYIGSSYCYGGVAPPCFDCSGFVVYIYRPHLPRLPRMSRDMVRFGRPVSRTDVLPGDLLFFATGPDPNVITHVSIYIGQNSIIHAISDGPNRGINITELTSRYWRARYHSALRVLPRESWGGGSDTTAGTGTGGTPTERQTTSTTTPLQFARGMYTGGLLNGEPHGKGTMKLNNGDTYNGRFAEGLFSGTGTYTWTNGAVYRGEFRGGVIEGEGTFTLANGDEYSGEFQEGYFHCKVEYRWISGGVYRGEWRRGLQHGTGTYRYPNGRTLSGMWQDGSYIGSSGAGSSGTDAQTGIDSQSFNRVEEAVAGAGEGPEQATTYFQVEDSPWDTWEGYIRGDYENWQEWLQQEERDFEEWKKNN